MSSSPATHKPALAHMATRGFSIRTRLIALVLAALLPALWADLWVVNLTHRLEREASARLLATTSGWQAYTLDDTALLKQGDQSVGVSNQYAGCIGGLANCQSLVTLGVAWAVRSVWPESAPRPPITPA